MDHGKMALLIIDMCKDFVWGSLKCERAASIVPNLQSLAEAARRAGVPVIYSNDAHLRGLDHELGVWGEHSLAGSEGAQVIEELRPREQDYVVPKRTYSGFYQTDLELLLRDLGVDTVILTGLHANICIRHTAADAFFRRLNIIVPKDGVEAFTEEAYIEGLEYLKMAYKAEITTTKGLIAELAPG
jgi:nicotinamidase-related amidase